ncbi:flagellar assembly protein A [Paenisporosarcina cavernae]|uniref:DUF342 domain-containing protein n=1 Tax=Paenisporosarcina cavernae TaxID=2320858 RepID=A0A385YT56_9BACL|nr:FapA family protein [Paenisporosarcina cavernae]AYC28868.1 DUF342 domain-containing protein [Paenisporosarcina cavernae]
MEPSITIKADTIEEATQTALSILQATVDQVRIEVLHSPKKNFLGIVKQQAEVSVTKLGNLTATPLSTESSTNISPNQQSVAVQESAVSIDEITSTPLSKASAEPMSSSIEKAIPTDMEDLVDFFLAEENSDVFATYDEAPTPQDTNVSTQITEDMPFGAWVENQVLYIHEDEKKYPVIAPGKNVTLKVNGLKVTDRIAVSKTDRIGIDYQDEVTPSEFSIQLMAQNTRAVLFVRPGKIVHRTLQDQPVANFIQLEVDETVEFFNDLKLDDVYEKVQQLGIKQGIDYHAIEQAMVLKEPGEVVIAEGISPIQGKDGELDWLVEEVIETEKDDTEKVDFREANKIVNVEEGEIIASKIPATPGKPGKDLFGEPIFPKEVQEIIIKTGKNTTLKHDRVVAVAPGRPSIEWRGRLVKIDIIKEYLHQGDVGIDSGHIQFQGDVRVLGNVNDSMNVTASGRVNVKGTVTRGNIQAGQSMYIGDNVFSSTLSVGRENFVISELVMLLREILGYTDNMQVALHQLLVVRGLQPTELTSRELNHLLRLLFEKKYTNFRDIVMRFVNKVRMHISVLSEEWTNLADSLYESFIVVSSNPLESMAAYEALNDDIRATYESHRIPPEPKAFLTVPYAINSTLYCSGNINVTGHGVYHSVLKAGNDVSVQGVCRGGEIRAGRNVTLDEVGSEVGVKTVISVPADGIIRIDYAHPNTNILIGNRQHSFASGASRIIAKLNADGNLELH